jgi:hypothetical protein
MREFLALVGLGLLALFFIAAAFGMAVAVAAAATVWFTRLLGLPT